MILIHDSGEGELPVCPHLSVPIFPIFPTTRIGCIFGYCAKLDCVHFCLDATMSERQMKSKTKSGRTTRARVKKEMAKPRMAKSARIAELNLDTKRIPDQPSTSLPGTVDKTSPLRDGANRRKHKLPLTDPTICIDVSALRIR